MAIFCRMDYSSFPSDTNGWNKLILEFKIPAVGAQLKLNKPIKESIFNFRKMPAMLHFGFIHLYEHKFQHDFKDITNLVCFYHIESESASHSFLKWNFYVNLTLLRMP